MTSPEEPPVPSFALRFSERARTDIDAGYSHFVETTNEQIADEWKDSLFDAVVSLARQPKRCGIAPENDRFGLEVRQYIYRRRPGSPAYRILFSVAEDSPDGPTVTVLHVRHGAKKPISRGEAWQIEQDARGQTGSP